MAKKTHTHTGTGADKETQIQRGPQQEQAHHRREAQSQTGADEETDDTRGLVCKVQIVRRNEVFVVSVHRLFVVQYGQVWHLS